MLRNRYYVGVVKFEGVEYPGKHEPLISEQLYARAQQVRAARRQSGEKPRVHTHYLKGTLYCGNCGELLTFEQSRNRVGTLYDYFYCLGRQRLKNGCTFKATQAHMVEDLVEQHWSTVTLSDTRLAEVRRLVLEHMETLLPNQDRAEAKAKRDIADLAAQSDRLMQAFYADAIALDQLKQEQSRISAARAAAESLIERNTTDRETVLERLDYLCTLLASPARYYENAPTAMRRELNQGIFERIYVFDDEIVGSNLTEPVQRLLSEDLKLHLARERKRVLRSDVRTNDLENPSGVAPILDRGSGESVPDISQEPSDARLSTFLAIERPRGHFPWERKNPGPFKVRGSNDHFLVAGAGFEPTTSGL
ncbi:recombinase zinc beta ribbon domain-containing protein [Rathayibacter sp. SD072]|nr:recombinase zinc beta ribbon domain-containing protein [Rathayibacter sp. SD072]